MASMRNNPRRRHNRSSSTPPLWLPREDEQQQRRVASKTIRPHDLETTIYQEELRRRELQDLRDEYSDFNSNLSRRALHFKNVRENPTLRGFFDTARDFDQELLDLKFQLAGPNEIYYVPEEDAENAVRCIRRTMAVLVSARWQIWRCVDLWEVHARHDTGDKLIYSAVLKKFVSPGMLAIELECHRNWQKGRPWLERLLGELKSEVPRMRWIVSQLEENRGPSFIRDLKESSPRGKNSKAPAFLPSCLTSGQRSGSRQYEMSGALPTDESNTRKTSTWVNNMKLRLEGHTINDPTEVDLSAVPARIRYRELKAREKLQGGENLEAMRDAWVAFQDDLDKRTGPPSTDVILLRHKVVTEVILAERRLQKAREQKDR
ncbi:hypothetical protein F4774DRAFT_387745 [Daldinia eschscholtzii]|nr:hypothetical protein F4774DRAFT_387745 [Daldinia eschscholtzii]